MRRSPATTEERPCCVRCSRRMRIHSRKANGKPRFRCPDCRLVKTLPNPEQAKSEFDARPHCVKCRRLMWRQLQLHGHRFRFRCPVCEASCYESESGRSASLPFTSARAGADSTNPNCVTCQRRMQSRGVKQWKCHGCGRKVRKSLVGAVYAGGIYQLGKRGRKATRPLLPGQPKQRTCSMCSRSMKLAGVRPNG